MEKDLEFLINALSMPDLPIWRTYRKAELAEMRDSFITLQQLLRSNPMDMEHIPCYPIRVKAGGNMEYKPATTDLSPVVSLLKYRFETPMQNVSSQSRTTVQSISDTTSTCSTIKPSSSVESLEQVRQGDNETSSSENFLAVVPYQKQETSQELVLYTGQRDEEDDDYDDDDSETLCGSSSLLSISIPMQMEYVWHNDAYVHSSTDSEMTITADGLNYILGQ